MSAQARELEKMAKIRLVKLKEQKYNKTGSLDINKKFCDIFKNLKRSKI